MMKNKVLVIPGAFVPYNDTVTLLTYKHLRNIDAEFDVVALKGPEDKGLKLSVEEDNKMSKFNIEYVCNYDDAVATLERKNVLSGIYNIFRYCKYAVNKSKKENYSVVYTSSIPAFTHLAGYWIKKKKKEKITWIASISDPLHKSPYKYDKETIKGYNIISRIGFYVYIFIYMNGYYEKICQKYADKIIYICEEERDFCISHYQNPDELRNKSMLIPLNYIEKWDIYKNLYSNVNSAIRKPTVVSHFGRVYGLRKIDNFLLALKSMKDEDNELSSSIIFKQYGEFNERYKRKIKELELDEFFVFCDKISYDDVMKLMKESDALALFDTILPESQIQPYLPSKSLEYILLRKPLLILTTKKSPAYRIFNALGYECCLDNIDSIRKGISNLLDKNSSKNYDIHQFENEILTMELKQYIESCIAKGGNE